MTGLTFAAPCGPAGVGRQAIDRARNRILIGGAVFFAAFVAVGFRLADLTLLGRDTDTQTARHGLMAPGGVARADVTDRNGVLLATSLATASLFADTRVVPDPAQAAAQLAAVLPDVPEAVLRERLSSGRGFVWLKRNLTPRQEYEVNRLGIPGLDFKREERRVYPMGALAAHTLGFTDVDGRGIAGVEKTFDDMLGARRERLALALDVRVQNVLTQALGEAMAEFRAAGATGLVMDVRTGELLAMVSLPDYDPNRPPAGKDAMFNRAALGVYEMGSTFKMFTVAMALDAGVATMDRRYDATQPIKISRFTINDFHGQKRWLTPPEIFKYSSNIGAARMALDAGGAAQRAFLQRIGLLSPSPVELPEVGSPLAPDPWRDINTMTIGFGHGISITPIQLASAASAVINGGILHPATIVRRPADAPAPGRRVLSARTSDEMRKLFRLVVADGTGRLAEAKGYLVGGKTGTAEKVGGRRYKVNALLSSFVGAFPINDPRYLVVAIVDEPHGNKKSHGYATGGWTAAPAVREVVERIAPMLGVMPVEPGDEEIDRALKIDVRDRAAGGRTVASR